MTYREHIDKAAIEYLSALMTRHAGNVTAAAVEAGVNRCSLHEMLRRHGLQLVRTWVPRGNAQSQALQRKQPLTLDRPSTRGG